MAGASESRSMTAVAEARAGRKSREWTDVELKRMRAAVESGDLTVAAVSQRFRCSMQQVRDLIAEHGWRNPYAERSAPKPKAGKPPKPQPYDAARYDRDTREEAERQQRALYTGLYDDAVWLRRRGFAVNVEGDKYRVGNKLCTAAEMQAIAERERRLAEPERTAAPVRRVAASASGLKVGEVVALAPKKPATQAKALPKRAPAPAIVAPTKPKAPPHSTDLGAKPRVVWLDLGLLAVDRRYQRDIGGAGQAHVNAILREFNWNRYQPIVVSERADGTYAVIDGQHRLEAARKHPLISELPCYIVDAGDIAAEAAIFSSSNSRRLGLTSQQKYWAAYVAGDAVAVAIHKLCGHAGVTILRAPPSYDIPPRSILSPFTVQKVFKAHGGAALATALRLLAEAHPKTLNAFRAPNIAALTRLAASKEFSASRMLAVLRKTDVANLHDEARHARVTGGGTLETATERVLRQRYDAVKPEVAA
jgi:hypothetical protein